ncbi:MAG: hypothetical protein IJ079_01245 [Lachnospiraceae bacterium]|nr:hypothetical protein [Lachnospiraceae bacterium]
MFTAYQDRLEITSIGTLPPHQTKEGFYTGVSIPVNDKLTEIFVQLHISEKSGLGVPRIVGEYGENAFIFADNAITVTIPYNRLDLGDIPQVPPKMNMRNREMLLRIGLLGTAVRQEVRKKFLHI